MVAAEVEAPRDGVREPPERRVRLATLLGLLSVPAHQKRHIFDALGS